MDLGRNIIYLLVLLLAFMQGNYLLCQTNTSPTEDAVFDESLWSSARAEGLAKAVATTANGMDAAYYNPAAIGGIEVSGNRPTINQLHFPYIAASVNNDTVELKQNLSKAGDLNDEDVAKQILRTQEGKRQYGRLSVVPNIIFWRTMISYVYDTQIAAAPEDTSTTDVSVVSRTVRGPSVGFSFKDPKQRFYFGLHSGFYQRDVIDATFSFTELNDPDTRRARFNDEQQHYEGSPITVGTIWVLAPYWRPSLALVFRDAGGTKYRNKDSSQEDLLVKEDATLSFSLSPNLKSWGTVHFTIEGEKLSQSGSSLEKKLKSSLEWTFGPRFGAEALIAPRIGINAAGVSYGAGINLGIIGLNLASSVEDVGVNNISVIERRASMNFAVNVADF